MVERIQLNEKDVDEVVGGAFWYWTEPDGSYHCKVDGIGVYNASTSAKRQISLYYLEDRSRTAEDLVNYALSNGLFW